MKVHLVDGTYELFRHFYAVPRHRNREGREVGAARGVVRSLLDLVRGGATHVGVATDHVIESFRNRLYPGYKTGHGIDPDLYAQFGLLEEALRAFGFVVWAMEDFEADDALAAAARMAAAEERVEQVLVCTPDKDLAQCVTGTRVVQLDRRRRSIRDEAGVRERFGVGPRSIPDYLALVGDSADGYPGLRGFGPRSAAALLGRFEHLEAIPADPACWGLKLRGAERLAATLEREAEAARLYRTLATLRADAPVSGSVDELAWPGPGMQAEDMARSLEGPALGGLAEGLAGSRSGSPRGR